MLTTRELHQEIVDLKNKLTKTQQQLEDYRRAADDMPPEILAEWVKYGKAAQSTILQLKANSSILEKAVKQLEIQVKVLLAAQPKTRVRKKVREVDAVRNERLMAVNKGLRRQLDEAKKKLANRGL